jgi:hypothetical protein
MTLILIKKIFYQNTGFVNGDNGIQDVIKNKDKYLEFFKANHVNAQIESYKEKECLKTTFDSGIEALYGPELIKINKKIL